MFGTKQCNLKGQSDGAFTSTDLITVVAAFVVLGAIQWPSMANTKTKGQSTSCLSNHRQLVRAWQSYAQDNDGRLVGNLDGGRVSDGFNSNATWVLGWLDFAGGALISGMQGGLSNTNTFVLSQASPLAKYLGRSAAVFKCPADTSLSFRRRAAPRVRSLSMNGYMGIDHPYTGGYKVSRRLSEIIDPAPSKAFVFIDEREDSINDAVLHIDMSGASPLSPTSYAIVDYPADWHNRGANLSFADGHTETWRWRDPRTMPPHRGVLIPLAVASPDNPDVARIQAATSRKIVQGN